MSHVDSIFHPDAVHSFMPQRSTHKTSLGASSFVREGQELLGVEIPNANLRQVKNANGEVVSYPVKMPVARKATALPPASLYQRHTRRAYDVSTAQFSRYANKMMSLRLVGASAIFLFSLTLPKVNATVDIGDRLGHSFNPHFVLPGPKVDKSYAA